jgi:hypothetical protein
LLIFKKPKVMLKNMMGLQGVSPLGRDAQKQIKGGSEALGQGGGSGSCAILLPPNYTLTQAVSISADHWYESPSGLPTGSAVGVGISKATVMQLISSGGGAGVHWCCASCASASWIP